MKKLSFLFMMIILMGNFFSCENNDSEEEIPFLPELSVVIDGKTIENWSITTSCSSPDGNVVGFVAAKGNYGIIIDFPAYCGNMTFHLNETIEAQIIINGTDVKNGDLSITKYIEEKAFVRGKFKFELTNDTIYNVSGTFSMTHPTI